jgi:anti-anti-sigma factor
VESRIFNSPATASPWKFSRVPAAWTAEPHRNIVAGLVAGVVSLPLSIGLGALALAPLGPAYISQGVLAGLYAAAFIGLLTVLAGARGVAIYAPRSLVSFVIASVVADVLVGASWLPKDDPAVVLSALFCLLSMAGMFQLVFAMVRLPRLVKFIPTPVMAGFQNAAAITITLSQLHVMLGLGVKPALGGWLEALRGIQPLQMLIGAATLWLAFKGQRYIKRVPPLLLALVGGTLLYYVLSLSGLSASIGDTLGRLAVRIPDGREFAGVLALTQVPGFFLALPALAVGAFSIAVVASLDVLISAKVVENLSGQRGNSTRELLCIGVANSVTPLLGGIIGSISLAATTTNFRTGARNSLSLLTHSLLFLLIVVLLAPLAGFVPKVVIAALVLFAGIQLVDRWTFKLIAQLIRGRSVSWRNIAVDLTVIVLVTAVALSGEIAGAVGLGTVIAVIVFTVRMSQGMVRSVRYGDMLHSRRTREASDIEALSSNGRRIMIIELEGPLFFASAEQLHNRIDMAIAEKVRYVVLDIARVTEVDSTGAQIVVQTAQRMKALGVQLMLCGQDERSRTASLLRDHGVSDAITRERFFPDLDRALEWCENHLLAGLRSRDAGAGDHPFEQLDIVQGLNAQERTVFRATLERREYASGKTIFEQGEDGDALYILLSGSASVRMHLNTGDVRLVTFSPGTVFGEMALLDRERRSATVTADEALACYVLERSRFDALGEEHPRIVMTLLANLAREMSLRMRRANRALLDRG